MKKDYKNLNFNFEALDSCPFCGSRVMIPNGKINWLDVDFWYVICPNCNLKYMNPRPNAETYQEFYRELFWQQKVRNLGFKLSGQMWQIKKYKWDNEDQWEASNGRKNRIEKHRSQRIKTVLPILEEYCQLNKKSSVLEVGCGFGVTLEEVYKRHGSVVNAIEPSEEARDYIKKEGVINLIGSYASDLKNISKTNKKFNIIIFSHALENTTNPDEIIEYSKDCLVKGGAVYIQTPNLLVFDQMNPYHPFIFSSKALEYLAARLDMKYIQTSKTIDQMLVAVFKKN